MKARRLAVVVTLAVVATLTLGTAMAGSSSITLPGGAELAISIADPVTSTEFLVPAGAAGIDVDVSGTASVGGGAGMPGATLVYVIDVSGSTGEGGGTGCSPILECERAFVRALNEAAVAGGSVDEVGLVVFADTAAAADMSPDPSDQPIVAPDADSYVATVVNSTYSDVYGGDGGVGQFTDKPVGQFTNFAAGLQSVLDVVNASANAQSTVVFLSDGESNAGGSAFSAAVSALAGRAVIHSIAVGTASSCTGGTDGTLQEMADGTGGTCTHVPDPGDLPDLIPGLFSASLDSLEIAVDGGGKTAIGNEAIDPDLPHAGPVTVGYQTGVPGLAPGDHQICVTANGSDGEGTGSVEQCETIHLFQIDLAPDSATNELDTPGQGHTVRATILGADVDGRQVDFAVLSGPNAGKAGSGVTDGGWVDFTYEAAQGCANLGTDTIRACFTLNDPTGATGCDQVTKDWVDTTPPDVACVETANPHGERVPPGKNPDGFFELTAVDGLDPSPMIYLRDAGSGTVFGPFASGTRIKYTQAPDGTPQQKKMGSDRGRAGAIDWHIIGTDDACVYAVDCAGNVTACVDCLVPPPPK
jgi:hypothetical protein